MDIFASVDWSEAWGKTLLVFFSFLIVFGSYHAGRYTFESVVENEAKNDDWGMFDEINWFAILKSAGIVVLASLVITTPLYGGEDIKFSTFSVTAFLILSIPALLGIWASRYGK